MQQISRTFHLAKLKLCAIESLLVPLPQSLITTTLLSVSMNLTTLDTALK